MKSLFIPKNKGAFVAKKKRDTRYCRNFAKLHLFKIQSINMVQYPYSKLASRMLMAHTVFRVVYAHNTIILKCGELAFMYCMG
jgi:hypothetical protein